MSDDTLRRVRGICLALPEAFEQEAWGHPTFRVRKKMFAIYSDRTSSEGSARPGLRCNAPLGVQAHLVRTEPAKYYVPAYVGAKGWIGLYPDECTDDEIRAHVQQSYCMVAPKRLQALVPEYPALPNSRTPLEDTRICLALSSRQSAGIVHYPALR